MSKPRPLTSFLAAGAGRRVHAHGLPDLTLGALVASFAIGQLVDGTNWLPLIAPALVLLYNKGHKRLTESRLGAVVPRPEEHLAEFRKSWAYAGLGLLGIVAGLILLFAGPPAVGDSDLPLAMMFAFVLLITAWLEKVPRFSAEAVCLMLAAGFGLLFAWPEGASLLVGTIPMLLAGVVLLLRFLRAHPVPELPNEHDLV